MLVLKGNMIDRNLSKAITTKLSMETAVDTSWTVCVILQSTSPRNPLICHSNGVESVSVILRGTTVMANRMSEHAMLRIKKSTVVRKFFSL